MQSRYRRSAYSDCGSEYCSDHGSSNDEPGVLDIDKLCVPRVSNSTAPCARRPLCTCQRRVHAWLVAVVGVCECGQANDLTLTANQSLLNGSPTHRYGNRTVATSRRARATAALGKSIQQDRMARAQRAPAKRLIASGSGSSDAAESSSSSSSSSAVESCCSGDGDQGPTMRSCATPASLMLAQTRAAKRFGRDDPSGSSGVPGDADSGRSSARKRAAKAKHCNSFLHGSAAQGARRAVAAANGRGQMSDAAGLGGRGSTKRGTDEAAQARGMRRFLRSSAPLDTAAADTAGGNAAGGDGQTADGNGRRTTAEPSKRLPRPGGKKARNAARRKNDKRSRSRSELLQPFSRTSRGGTGRGASASS